MQLITIILLISMNEIIRMERIHKTLNDSHDEHILSLETWAIKMI